MRLTLYKTFCNNLNNLEKDKEGIIFSKEWSLVGINLENFNLNIDLENLKSKLKVKPIEVLQENFLHLIFFADIIDISIINIKFKDESLEDTYEIEDLLNEKNYREVISIISDDPYSFEIESITFELGISFETFKGTIIEFTDAAVIDVSNTLLEITSIIEQKPINLLLGKWYPKEEDQTNES